MQRGFEALYNLSLLGMNIGEGGDVSTSGEHHVLRLVAKRSAGRRPVVVDGGASTGSYTAAALAVMPDARIYALEPARDAFRALEQRFAADDRVSAHNLALGEEVGTLDLVAPTAGSKAGSLFDRSLRLGWTTQHRESVNVVTLDWFCRENGIETIDLLKLDLEGAEASALRGASTTLTSGYVDCIQFEFGAANVESRTFFRDFYELLTPDFELYRTLRKGLHPITQYDERLELFRRATNYLAIRRSAAPRC